MIHRQAPVTTKADSIFRDREQRKSEEAANTSYVSTPSEYLPFLNGSQQKYQRIVGKQMSVEYGASEV